MQVVRVSKSKNDLIFSYHSSKNLTNFINSNNIYKDELLYSFSYAKDNVKTVYDTIVKLIDTVNVKKIIIDTNEVAGIVAPVLSLFPKDVDIEIYEESSVNYELYTILSSMKNLKSIKCYFMPENYVRNFGEKNISVYFTFDKVFSNKFVYVNELKNMKNIYYKKNITVSYDTLADFKLFLKINRHLKIIHIYEYEKKLLDKLMKLIGSREYLILIHQSDDNIKSLSEDVKNLRKINKKYSKETNGEIQLVYSDDYFKNNLFRQLTFSNLKVCSVIIVYLAFIMLISNSYNDYVTWFNSNVIMNSLSTEETQSTDILIEYEDEEPVVPDVVEEEIPKVDPYANMPLDFESLLNMNKDTVGWLTVNNTKINYPVTQSADNNYYLNRDFYQRRTANGWVFMDYRNDAVNLSKNTIIYGHALLSGYMFGDLRNTIKSSWYKNKENSTIIFNILSREMKWEVFSVYRTPYTTDYLKVNFFDDEAFMEFVNLVRDRSVYNFGVKVESDDHIITLSTCTGNDNSRLVLHARLID